MQTSGYFGTSTRNGVVPFTTVPEPQSRITDAWFGTLTISTTLHVDVPKYPEVCTMEVGADDYRPLRMKFNRGLVLRQGQPLRVEEIHQLDQNASTLDMLLFPLQNLGDRIQNAAARKIRADYRLEVKLVPVG